MSQRIGYLDIARGIGILLVVLGHNDFGAISPFFHQVIYSFHIPLFFFLSGYFINTSISFFGYFKKRFHSVLKPYLFSIFLIYFTSISFGKMNFQTAILRIVKSLYGTADYIEWVPLWFLPNLFIVSLYAFIFITIVNKLRNRWVRWGLLLLTLVVSLPFLRVFYPFSISLFGKEYTLRGLLFSLDLLFLSGFFFILGNEAKQTTSDKTFDHFFLLFTTVFGLIALNFLYPYKIDFADRIYNSFLVNTTEAILGILVVLAVSRQIELHNARLATLFKYFGNISLIILVFHAPIQAFWGEKVLAMTNNLPLSILLGFIMGVLGSVLIYELFIRYNPVASYWFGRKSELPAQKEVGVEEQVVTNSPSTPIVEIKEQ